MKAALVAVVFLGAWQSTSRAHPIDGEGVPFHDLAEFASLQSGDPLADWSSSRQWTSADGRALKAKVVAVGDASGQFVVKADRRTTILLSKLSVADQQFLREWDAISGFFNSGYTASRNLSGNVKAAMFDGIYAKEGKIHETRNFRFECDVPLRANLAEDFSKLFEVTHAAVAGLPLGLSLERPDNKKIVVRLFAKKSDYLEAGGKEKAAGIYLLTERVVLVPLASLGIERADNGDYRKTREFDPGTLIHETTHAVTHHWLQHMPLWFSEGLAEYVAATPYRDGVLNFSKHEPGMRSLASKKFGGDAKRFEILAPEDFVHLDPWEFMRQPSKPERPINLPVVEPYQIGLRRGRGIVTAKGDVVTPGSSIPSKGIPGRPNSIVLRRYVSSMLLVDHLLKKDPVAVRKYLFALLHGEWARERYLDAWTEALGLHKEAVNSQISEFNSAFRQFQMEVGAFNDAVARHNANEKVKMPKRPVEPVPPDAIPVPDILAKPKSATELSRRAMGKRTVDEYLKLPAKLSLPAG